MPADRGHHLARLIVERAEADEGLLGALDLCAFWLMEELERFRIESRHRQAQDQLVQARSLNLSGRPLRPGLGRTQDINALFCSTGPASSLVRIGDRDRGEV